VSSIAQKIHPSQLMLRPGLEASAAELDAVRRELQTLLKEQPWSAELLPSWTTHENAWRPASRPESPGWDPADQESIGRLRAREVELVTVIVCHRFWLNIDPAERATALSALKHHHEQPQEGLAA
jgi:hypothetical protein